MYVCSTLLRAVRLFCFFSCRSERRHSGAVDGKFVDEGSGVGITYQLLAGKGVGKVMGWVG